MENELTSCNLFIINQFPLVNGFTLTNSPFFAAQLLVLTFDSMPLLHRITHTLRKKKKMEISTCFFHFNPGVLFCFLCLMCCSLPVFLSVLFVVVVVVVVGLVGLVGVVEETGFDLGV